MPASCKEFQAGFTREERAARFPSEGQRLLLAASSAVFPDVAAGSIKEVGYILDAAGLGTSSQACLASRYVCQTLADPSACLQQFIAVGAAKGWTVA